MMSVVRAPWIWTRASLVVLVAAASLSAVDAGADEHAGEHGTFSVSVTGGTIRISYTPDPARVQCSAIYLIQTCRLTDQNGAAIDPADVGKKFEHLGDDVSEDSTWVDHLASEADPYYNGGDDLKDKESKGSTEGPTPKPTKMSDGPSIGNRSFPPGVTTINACFEVCAVCDADGRVLDCTTWCYSRQKGRDPGVISEGPGPAVPPTGSFLAALAVFADTHAGGCPEARAESRRGENNLMAAWYSNEPREPVDGQPTRVDFRVVNMAGQPVANVEWQATDLNGLRTLGSGVLGSIDYFSYATVSFYVPPLAAAQLPDVVVLRVDAGGAIPEFDETDNSDTVILDDTPVSVDESPAVVVAAQAPSAKPSPSFGKTTISFALLNAGEVRVAVFTADGRRVRNLLHGKRGPGVHAVEWDGMDERGLRLPRGLYLVRIEQPRGAATVKVISLR